MDKKNNFQKILFIWFVVGALDARAAIVSRNCLKLFNFELRQLDLNCTYDHPGSCTKKELLGVNVAESPMGAFSGVRVGPHSALVDKFERSLEVFFSSDGITPVGYVVHALDKDNSGKKVDNIGYGRVVELTGDCKIVEPVHIMKNKTPTERAFEPSMEGFYQIDSETCHNFEHNQDLSQSSKDEKDSHELLSEDPFTFQCEWQKGHVIFQAPGRASGCRCDEDPVKKYRGKTDFLSRYQYWKQSDKVSNIDEKNAGQFIEPNSQSCLKNRNKIPEYRRVYEKSPYRKWSTQGPKTYHFISSVCDSVSQLWQYTSPNNSQKVAAPVDSKATE